MKRTLSLYALLLVAVVAIPNLASANPILQMSFIGAGSNQSGGESTYPYFFKIGSNPAQYNLMCDTFDRNISPGDHWTATVTQLSSVNAGNVSQLFYGGTVGVQGYLTGAYLFIEEYNAFTGGNTDPQGLFNWAMWDLFQGSDVSAAHLDSGQEAQVQSYLSAAEAATAGLTPADFPNSSHIVIYTPTDGVGQEFFGYDTPVPEPGTLALFGSGVIGLATLIRRKLPKLSRD